MSPRLRLHLIVLSLRWLCVLFSFSYFLTENTVSFNYKQPIMARPSSERRFSYRVCVLFVYFKENQNLSEHFAKNPKNKTPRKLFRWETELFLRTERPTNG